MFKRTISQEILQSLSFLILCLVLPHKNILCKKMMPSWHHLFYLLEFLFFRWDTRFLTHIALYGVFNAIINLDFYIYLYI